MESLNLPPKHQSSILLSDHSQANEEKSKAITSYDEQTPDCPGDETDGN